MDERFEKLKQKLFNFGTYAIESFLGCNLKSDYTYSKDELDNLMDQVYMQMPPEELLRYYIQYQIIIPEWKYETGLSEPEILGSGSNTSYVAHFTSFEDAMKDIYNHKFKNYLKRFATTDLGIVTQMYEPNQDMFFFV